MLDQLPLGDLVFTLVVFVAVMAVLTDTYPDVIMAGVMLLVIWQLVALFGASLLLVTVVLLAIGLVRAGATLAERLFSGDVAGEQVMASLLEHLIAGRTRPPESHTDTHRHRADSDQPPQDRIQR